MYKQKTSEQDVVNVCSFRQVADVHPKRVQNISHTRHSKRFIQNKKLNYELCCGGYYCLLKKEMNLNYYDNLNYYASIGNITQTYISFFIKTYSLVSIS